jgi:hypothetical protein
MHVPSVSLFATLAPTTESTYTHTMLMQAVWEVQKREVDLTCDGATATYAGEGETGESVRRQARKTGRGARVLP